MTTKRGIAPPSRVQFVESVAKAFEQAGVRYAILHGATAARERDSAQQEEAAASFRLG